MTALILVDLQNDFMPGGALAVKEGNKVLPAVNRLLSHPFDLIVATQDWHPENHISFAATHGKQPLETIIYNDLPQILWPTHCLQQSLGAKLCPGWDHSKVNVIIHKGSKTHIDSYSTFFDNAHLRETGLNKILQEKNITKLYIAGLATDYCVKFSVLDALKLGFETYVITDGCSAVNLQPGDEAKALREMTEAGAHLMTSEELIKSNG